MSQTDNDQRQRGMQCPLQVGMNRKSKEIIKNPAGLPPLGTGYRLLRKGLKFPKQRQRKLLVEEEEIAFQLVGTMSGIELSKALGYLEKTTESSQEVRDICLWQLQSYWMSPTLPLPQLVLAFQETNLKFLWKLSSYKEFSSWPFIWIKCKRILLQGSMWDFNYFLWWRWTCLQTILTAVLKWFILDFRDMHYNILTEEWGERWDVCQHRERDLPFPLTLRLGSGHEALTNERKKPTRMERVKGQGYHLLYRHPESSSQEWCLRVGSFPPMGLVADKRWLIFQVLPVDGGLEQSCHPNTDSWIGTMLTALHELSLNPHEHP